MGDRSSGKPSRERSGRAGFSLVELIIALVMMTIGIVAAAGLVAGVARTQRRAAARSQMTEVGQSKLEQLRAYATMSTIDTMELVVGGSLTTSEDYHTETVASGGNRQFILRWEVVEGPSNTRQVTIRVVPLNAAPDDVSSIDFRTLVLRR